MTSHANPRSAILGLGSLVLALCAGDGRDLSAAPAAAPVASPEILCERGTDQIQLVGSSAATTLRWFNRPYIIHLPPAYDGTTPLPVVMVLHAGGDSAQGARMMTCPNGNLDDPGCLDRVADCDGFITVYPDGTPDPVTGILRTFDAGGGAAGYACVSGIACAARVDDVRYVADLLDTLEQDFAVDPSRIYLTGLSNGAAMSQRLACELSDRIAAIAPVAGGNQFAALDDCSPARPVPVLEIHGSADHCWPYAGGWQYCVGVVPLTSLGNFVPIAGTVASWAARNGCRPTPVTQDLPDADPTDGTTVTRIGYQGCANGADVVLLRVNGGGHTWPEGWSALSTATVGRISREFSANAVLWEFFRTHPMN